jgi:hypothetical protein
MVCMRNRGKFSLERSTHLCRNNSRLLSLSNNSRQYNKATAALAALTGWMFHIVRCRILNSGTRERCGARRSRDRPQSRFRRHRLMTKPPYMSPTRRLGPVERRDLCCLPPPFRSLVQRCQSLRSRKYFCGDLVDIGNILYNKSLCRKAAMLKCPPSPYDRILISARSSSPDKANALRVCFIRAGLAARKDARMFVALAPPRIARSQRCGLSIRAAACSHVVMAKLVPAIQFFLIAQQGRRGCRAAKLAQPA